MTNIIDLDDIFKTWAWSRYLKTTTGVWRLFRANRENVTIRLQWERVKLTPILPLNYKEETFGTSIKMVFESEYENHTSVDQTHRFRAQRETESTALFVLTKGFRQSSKVHLELPLPGDMRDAAMMPDEMEKPTKRKMDQTTTSKMDQTTTSKMEQTATSKIKQIASVSFGNSVLMDSERGDTIKKKLKWEADTAIVSEKNKQIMASLEVEEASSEYSFDFKVKLEGRIVAVISETRGRQRHLLIVEGDVANVIYDTVGTALEDVELYSLHGVCLLPMAGTLTFKYGVSQKVKIAYKESSDGDCR